MDTYSLQIEDRAARELRDLPKQDAERVVRRIHALTQDPRPPGVMKLSGADGYRIRQGDWRVVYLLDDDAKRVDIVKIGHRREVYR